MSDVVLQIQGLFKSYGESWFSKKKIDAVRDINLEARRGEIWAFAGPNGAGKTTTLHCLLGLLKPDAGRVRVMDQDPGMPEARRAMGFQSEIFFSYLYLTGREALAFYGRLCDLAGPDLESRIGRALAAVGLADVQNRRLATYSKGMMQRLGLAQSYLHDPAVIIWDEPSTGLDPEGRRMVSDLIAEFKNAGKTVLLSTHILADVERVCDHIAIINHGRMLLTEDLTGLREKNPEKTLEDIYLETVRRDDVA